VLLGQDGQLWPGGCNGRTVKRSKNCIMCLSCSGWWCPCYAVSLSAQDSISYSLLRQAVMMACCCVPTHHHGTEQHTLRCHSAVWCGVVHSAGCLLLVLVL